MVELYYKIGQIVKPRNKSLLRDKTGTGSDNTFIIIDFLECKDKTNDCPDSCHKELGLAACDASFMTRECGFLKRNGFIIQRFNIIGNDPHLLTKITGEECNVA